MTDARTNPELQQGGIVEQAQRLAQSGSHQQAKELILSSESLLSDSPRYLHMAGQVLARMGLHMQAESFLRQALVQQPSVPLIQASVAENCVYLGKTEEARKLYWALLQRFPQHQRHHYQLSQVETAKDDEHVRAMLKVLKDTRLSAEKNIFLYFALGKELEDLKRWDEAFHWYEKANSAAAGVARYDVSEDLAQMQALAGHCDASWLAQSPSSRTYEKRPIFIVGMPRTGTTLVERIIAAHSGVDSAGESYFMQLVLRQMAGLQGNEILNSEAIKKLVEIDPGDIAQTYLPRIDYRLQDKPVFTEKFPENFLYLGFIANAFPDATIVHVRRDPMDTCFALFKQSYFRYAYRLADLAEFYPAYHRLMQHWRELLGERLIEIDYETLVSDFENSACRLLEQCGLPFEKDCLTFQDKPAVVATASASQVREKVHGRSVGKWRYFEQHLRPLRERLQAR